MRRAVFPLLLFLFGFVLGLLCLFPIHTVSPKLDAAPLTASRAGEEPQPASEASTSGLLRAAARAAEALKAEDYETLGELVHPERGVTFTASSTVDPETDQNFTADEIRGLPEDPGQYLWGYEDGRGTPILLTMEEFVRQYIFSVDYTQAPEVGWTRWCSVETPWRTWPRPIRAAGLWTCAIRSGTRTWEGWTGAPSSWCLHRWRGNGGWWD